MKKKKAVIIIIIAAVLLLVLTVPYKIETYEDGGTREYTALTYKVVDWSKYDRNDEKYEKTNFYIFPNNLKSVDDLWAKESEKLPEPDTPVEERIPTAADYAGNGETFTALVKEIDEASVLIERMTGGEYIFFTENVDITKNGEWAHASDLRENMQITVTYDGIVLETYPAQLHTVYLVEIVK